MNDRRYYDPIDGHRISPHSAAKTRSMREIKSDFNKHLQNHCKSKVKR